MSSAIEEAKLGRGFVSPNPVVGCVIVDREHQFLSSGAHLKCGKEHAEINALNNVTNKKLLEKATVYVTLEPCAHQGKTGSCAEVLSQLPIHKVCYGSRDPHSLVAGKGIEILESRGKQTQCFTDYQEACRELADQFFYHIQNKRPFVSLKVGASLDGKIALKSGESQWVTGEKARTYARELRAHYDATLIGAGTLIYDDPTLDFRGTSFAGKKDNKIIVLDPKGKAFENFKNTNLFKNHEAKNIFILTASQFFENWSPYAVNTAEWNQSEQGWKLSLEELYSLGIHSIYAEGGAFVFGQLLQFNLVNKFYMFQAPKILGEGLSWSQLFQNDKLANAPQLKKWKTMALGDDKLHTFYF